MLITGGGGAGEQPTSKPCGRVDSVGSETLKPFDVNIPPQLTTGILPMCKCLGERERREAGEQGRRCKGKESEDRVHVNGRAVFQQDHSMAETTNFVLSM